MAHTLTSEPGYVSVCEGTDDSLSHSPNTINLGKLIIMVRKCILTQLRGYIYLSLLVLLSVLTREGFGIKFGKE